MKPTFTLIEKTGDPSHLTPMEIALSRCSWSPSETITEVSDPAEPQAADQVDACLMNAIGKLSSMHCETRVALSKLLDTPPFTGSAAPFEPVTALFESDDCEMQFVDSMPSAEGLLMCVLLRQKEQSSDDVDGLPLSFVQ